MRHHCGNSMAAVCAVRIHAGQPAICQPLRQGRDQAFLKIVPAGPVFSADQTPAARRMS
jgi:hypothetical protein